MTKPAKKPGKNPAKNIVARDLMTRTFEVIGDQSSLEEATERLLATQGDHEAPNALVVTGAGGEYLGLLTARLLFRSLLSFWMPSRSVIQDPLQLDRELLSVARERAHVRVGDALIRGLPTVQADDRLLTVIAAACEARREFTPVLENGKAIGLIPIATVFQRAAALALTPDDEGIRLDGKVIK